MNLLLVRDLDDGQCTLGVLTVGSRTYQTIEKPWIPGGGKGGLKGASCVPCGTYQLEPHNTEAHPKVFALVNHELDVYHWGTEPGYFDRVMRSLVLIHIANRASELRGCIAPGRRRYLDGKTWTVQESKNSINEIRSIVPWQTGHTLTIRR